MSTHTPDPDPRAVELRNRVDSLMPGAPMHLPEVERIKAAIAAAEEAFDARAATSAQVALLARRDAMNARYRRAASRRRRLEGGGRDE